MKKLLVRLLLPFTLICSLSCGKKELPIEPIDAEGAATAITKANRALERVLFALISGPEVEHPQDIDFTEPYNLYQQAFAKDPGNRDANFGLALTSILMLSQDQQLQQAFDEWKVYLEENSPFEAPLRMQGGSHLKVGFPTSISYFEVPAQTLAKAAVGTEIMAIKAAPKLSFVQQILESKLLPKLDFAIEAFDWVDDDPKYQFIITPRMQGDPNEDSLEVDLTEIYALQVSLHALRAAADIAIAYNFDFTDYDSLGMHQALQPGSSFFSLRNSGASLAEAKSSLLNAIEKLELGIAFLRKERDDQSNDIIKIGRDDVHRADLDSILAHTEDARDILTESFMVTADWNDDGREEDLRIHLGKFFDNPISDFKAKLPAYEIAVERDTVNYSWNWLERNVPVSTVIQIPQSGYHSYSRSYEWYGSKDQEYFYSDLVIPRFNQVFDSLKTALLAKPGIAYLRLNLDWSGYYDQGNRTITNDIYYYYVTIHPTRVIYVPVFHWQASTFDEWQFPDPTFNGIFPDLTTDHKLKRAFGIVERDWRPSFRLEWDDGGF